MEYSPTKRLDADLTLEFLFSETVGAGPPIRGSVDQMYLVTMSFKKILTRRITINDH